jgi:TetR/AcrR family transcriptional repressor of nem operon
MAVFWAKGYAATSTEDLTEAMRIGRQSLYNAFDDKRRLYLEALAAYQERTIGGHLKRLSDPASPAKGIRDLLSGLVADDDKIRALGCMGVGSVGEFGTSDPEISALRAKVAPLLGARLVERLLEGQAKGEINPDLKAEEAAGFIQLMMTGIQVAARAGVGAKDLKRMARFAADRLLANE